MKHVNIVISIFAAVAILAAMWEQWEMADKTVPLVLLECKYRVQAENVDALESLCIGDGRAVFKV